MDDLPLSQPTRRPVSPSAEEILGGYFPVLDHGFVSLVDYMGTDEDVERAARVSYGYGTRKRSATRGLIRYLRRHRHTTPFEMVEFKFHCSMPMFVARQWIRHRTASVNEYSGRYSLMPLLFYTPGEDEFALQSDANNQGRGQAAAKGVYEEVVRRWTRGRQEVQGSYEWMLEEDVARELARIDLPLSTYTQWYWKIDLHNLLHFLSLRADSHAQWEIQEYARVMAGMVQRVAPLTFEAWLDYEFQGAHFSRAERAALAQLVTMSPHGEVRAAGSGKSISTGDLEGMGLSSREIGELALKLQLPDLPDFALDLSAMRPGDEVGKEMAQAVPEVVKRKTIDSDKLSDNTLKSP